MESNINKNNVNEERAQQRPMPQQGQTQPVQQAPHQQPVYQQQGYRPPVYQQPYAPHPNQQYRNPQYQNPQYQNLPYQNPQYPNNAYPQYQPKPEEPYNCTPIDDVFAFIVFAIGILFVDFILTFLFSLGMGASVFMGILLVFTAVYFIKSGIKIPKGSWAIMGCIVISSIYFLLFSNVLLSVLNLMFVLLCYVYWVSAATGTRIRDKIGTFITADICRHIFIIPFLNLGAVVKSIRETAAKSGVTKAILLLICGTLIALPLTVVVIVLLSNADPAFARIIDSLIGGIIRNIPRFFLDLILGIPLAFYLFGLLFGCVKKRRINKTSEEEATKKYLAMKVIPRVMAYGALTSFLVIYVLFYISQIQYLFSGLPEGMTYAAFARRGFFELCAVAFINLAIILSSKLFVKYTDGNTGDNKKVPKVLKFFNICMSLCTIGFIAIAIRKMALYIDTYALTQLRVYTSWFMIFLFFIFAVVILHQFWSKLNIAKIITCIGVIMFMILCFANTDAIIARYNAGRYLTGESHIRIRDFDGLSDAAAPYVAQIIRESDSETDRNEARAILRRMRNNNTRNSWRSFNLSTHRAEAIYEEYLG